MFAAAVLGLVLASPVLRQEWLGLSFFYTDATVASYHDARTGIVIHAFHSRRNGKEDVDRIRSRSRFEDGSDRWEVVELDDPAHEAKALARDILGADGRLAPESYYGMVVEAQTPPSECQREVQYRMQAAGEWRQVFSAVPCSNEQRDRMESFLRAQLRGLMPEALNDERLKKAPGIVPATLDLLRPGLRVESVLEELGLPFGMLPAYPDGFSLEYWPSDALPGVDMVLIDFDKQRTVTRVRLGKELVEQNQTSRPASAAWAAANSKPLGSPPVTRTAVQVAANDAHLAAHRLRVDGLACAGAGPQEAGVVVDALGPHESLSRVPAEALTPWARLPSSAIVAPRRRARRPRAAPRSPCPSSPFRRDP